MIQNVIKDSSLLITNTFVFRFETKFDKIELQKCKETLTYKNFVPIKSGKLYRGILLTYSYLCKVT